VRVHAGGFVHHQQMLIFENQARQHRNKAQRRGEIGVG
jgi:hypothetical protein